ncbi:MAG: hypothetical protein HOO96_09235 [Polyangiaceae bacterium]|nr:hypothetical protein [Polyangiaceae bacterium]
MPNLFEQYDLRPEEGIRVITERLRERIEDARSEEERAALRDAWERLTRNPEARLREALLAAPETRPSAPLSAGEVRADAEAELSLGDLVPPPRVAASFSEARSPRVPLHRDPLLLEVLS